MDRPFFLNRPDAGRRLADALPDITDPRTIVLGVPRGGVPVAAEIARRRSWPLDVLVSRKIPAPGNPELALGALSMEGQHVLNTPLLRELGLTAGALRPSLRRTATELERRLILYRQGRPPLDLKNRTALVVDDGVATGATMIAACRAARALGAKTLIAAVPVASPEAAGELADATDRFISLYTGPLGAVGEFYEDFSQVDDQEVLEVLRVFPRSSVDMI